MSEHFRRIDPRYERQLDVELVLDGKRRAARTRNISLGGMYAEMQDGVSIGAAVQLRFLLPTQPEAIEVAGDVRWVVRKGPADPVGMGIRFEGLRARDVWALNRFFQTST